MGFRNSASAKQPPLQQPLPQCMLLVGLLEWSLIKLHVNIDVALFPPNAASMQTHLVPLEARHASAPRQTCVQAFRG